MEFNIFRGCVFPQMTLFQQWWKAGRERRMQHERTRVVTNDAMEMEAACDL
jgi:hypothetical protein